MDKLDYANCLDQCLDNCLHLFHIVVLLQEIHGARNAGCKKLEPFSNSPVHALALITKVAIQMIC